MSKYNKEELEKLIFEDQLPYDVIGLQYGCTGSNIRKTAQRLGIVLPQRRKINEAEHFNRKEKEKLFCINCGKELLNYSSGQKKYCSNQCQGEYQSEEKWKYFLTDPDDLQRANWSLPDSFREKIFKEQDCKCAICGMTNIWNNKPIVFIFDHIDGNAANNTRKNYRAVCPNCDSQLDTYKSKNKNGARSYYRYNKGGDGILGSS